MGEVSRHFADYRKFSFAGRNCKAKGTIRLRSSIPDKWQRLRLIWCKQIVNRDTGDTDSSMLVYDLPRHHSTPR
jgi:hypothetical protein